MDGVTCAHWDNTGVIELTITKAGKSVTYQYIVDAAMIPLWVKQLRNRKHQFKVLSEVKHLAYICQKVGVGNDHTYSAGR